MDLHHLLDPALGGLPDAGMLGGRLRPARVRRGGAMELVEAFEILAGGATGAVANQAVGTIRERALAFALADGRCDGTLADDCAQVVVTKLWTRFASGQNPVLRRSSDACAVYIRTMVTNWLTDRIKTETRRRGKRELLRREVDVVREPADDPAADAASGRWIRALLERVAEYAIAKRVVRQREHLATGWKEICELVFDEIPLRTLLERSGALSCDATREQVRSARNVAYKRHERTRAALTAAVSAMEAEGALTAEEAQAAELAVRGLARRNRLEPPQEES